MATGDNTASVPFPRLSQTRREGIPHVPGTTKSWPRRGAGARIIAKEHGLTPAGDAQEIRPSTRAIIPAQRPGRVLLARVPLGQPPFLHQLRHRLPGLVRQLRRYYAAVRLPAVVHLGLTASAFPERPALPSQPDGQPRDLPVLAPEDSTHAQALCPRGVRWQLALTRPAMLPS